MATQKFRKQPWNDGELPARKPIKKHKKARRAAPKSAPKSARKSAPAPAPEPQGMPMGDMGGMPMMDTEAMRPLEPASIPSLGADDTGAMPLPIKRGGRRKTTKRPMTRIERAFLNG